MLVSKLLQGDHSESDLFCALWTRRWLEDLDSPENPDSLMLLRALPSLGNMQDAAELQDWSEAATIYRRLLTRAGEPSPLGSPVDTQAGLIWACGYLCPPEEAPNFIRRCVAWFDGAVGLCASAAVKAIRVVVDKQGPPALACLLSAVKGSPDQGARLLNLLEKI